MASSTTTPSAFAISIIFPTQTWLVNTNGIPNATNTFLPGNYTCPVATINSSPNQPGNNAFGVPIDVPQATYLLTVSSAGTDVAYSCAYPLLETHSVSSSYTTKDSTLPETTKPEPTTEVPQPTSTQVNTPESSVISPSAASGIGIGAFILGLALGLAFAACYIFRRRRCTPKTAQSPNEERSAMLIIPKVPPIPPAKDPSPTQSTPRSTATILPTLIGQTNSSLHGASDETLASELAFLGQLIRDHAANNYHLEPVNADINVLKQSLGGLNLDEATQNQIAALAMEPHTRFLAIRHLLALTIFSVVDIHYAHGRSLLPDGVAAFIKGLPFEKGDDSRGATTALDTWRRASSYLLHRNTDKHTPLSPGPDAKSQIDEFQSGLNTFLCHFTHEDSRAVFDQTKNLEGVIQECVVFGYAVFSHPCLWRFTYVNQSNSEKTSLVVLPGLEKLSGRDGVVFERVEMLAPPSVANV